MFQTPPPPPVVRRDLPTQERALSFPGFNGHPLKGTVTPPQGAHPYFAVMVAGTGPMDRDWSSPALPKGKPGRDLALWLQARGIGVLRYDKRYIGSTNPALDISLEAQAGDLKAALDAARALPEAKGRKMLLVAHSEGTLVALVVAREADGALLVAMPGMSMAALLRAQVQALLPPEAAPAGLGYLDEVMKAIRENQPLPDPKAGVAPGLVQLGRSLMAKESLTFVKGTLDLDPWALASRLPIPVACVWGDRDIQSPRPPVIPATFRGTVIDLPEANHLLRKEVRPRGTLDPLKAQGAYGEATPLADLEPLATWLATLK